MGLAPEHPKAFLGVERSITGRRWIARLQTDRMAQAIAQAADVSDIMGRILAARGVLPETANSFLEPTLRELMPPAAQNAASQQFSQDLLLRVSARTVSASSLVISVTLHAGTISGSSRSGTSSILLR